ncbi:HDOD domain-containing protein [Janthinobacterium agaricidamnosum]|uniref:HDOD domain protein n=1 Tax=Janthinobacterium agaricidamnosum NBRC 102515 = DSM 9628 TaxID=1349767 RepID=W0V9W9_9BURK|nr:HDOD domain protein [Janthinobacterium agaricidamnosum NBRC 102515 = DSM 9628]
MAVILHLPLQASDAALSMLLSAGDVFAALAPLQLIVTLSDPCGLSDSVLAALPARRTLLRIPSAVAAGKPVQQRCLALADDGYRILLDGAAGMTALKMGAHGTSIDSRGDLPSLHQLLALPGPHLVHQVDSATRLAECRGGGFSWFAGEHALHAARNRGNPDDGTSRKRLLTLLALLARDADAPELALQLRQDPSLSYHLLKLANSAAFGLSIPISNFEQAITLLGRRQLQRWLQLLLYARQQEDGGNHALLPLAAVRAAHMEALCKYHGGDRDQQDLAFMAGVFSLLDVLLGIPMEQILAVLKLDPEVALALRERGGELGRLLVLAESGHAIADMSPEVLAGAGIDAETYWRSLLEAYQWAIQVSRNL